MVVKVYISGISGNKEVKKRQQRVLMILDSRNVKYEVIDIAEPGNEEKKDFMQNNSTSSGATISDPTPRHPLPPQIFNDDVYCGDYDQFDMSNEVDEMEKFLKLAPDDKAPTLTSNANIKLGNGEIPTTDVTSTETIEKSDAKDEEIKEEDQNGVTNNQDNNRNDGEGDSATVTGVTIEKVEENGAEKVEDKAEVGDDNNDEVEAQDDVADD